MSWQGIKVRHPDGRKGSIRHDNEGFLHSALFINVDGGGEDFVQLNSNGPDTGSPGWEWYSEHSDGGPKWITLGDHANVATS